MDRLQPLFDALNGWLQPPADFLNEWIVELGISFSGGFVGKGADVPFMVILLLGAGVYLTVRTGFIQFRRLRHGFEVASGKYDNPDDPGDVSHFQALTTALSATVGIGNIALAPTAKPADTEAAEATALMVAVSSANSRIPPTVVVTPGLALTM